MTDIVTEEPVDETVSEPTSESPIAQARAAGRTDGEINAYLAPRWEKARAAGYSDDEIRHHLGMSPPARTVGGTRTVVPMSADWSKWRSADGLMAEQSGASSVDAYRNGTDLIPTREGAVK